MKDELHDRVKKAEKGLKEALTALGTISLPGEGVVEEILQKTIEAWLLACEWLDSEEED